MTRMVLVIYDRDDKLADYWYCPACGNHSQIDGFTPCDLLGSPVDDDEWDDRHYLCDRCNALVEFIFTKN